MRNGSPAAPGPHRICWRDCPGGGSRPVPQEKRGRACVGPLLFAPVLVRSEALVPAQQRQGAPSTRTRAFPAHAYPRGARPVVLT